MVFYLHIPDLLYPLFQTKQRSIQLNMYKWIKLAFEVCSVESFANFTLVSRKMRFSGEKAETPQYSTLASPLNRRAQLSVNGNNHRDQSMFEVLILRAVLGVDPTIYAYLPTFALHWLWYIARSHRDTMSVQNCRILPNL